MSLSFGGADLDLVESLRMDVESLRMDFWTFERVSPPSLVEVEPVEGRLGLVGTGVGTLGC